MKKIYFLLIVIFSQSSAQDWLDAAYGLWGVGVVSRDRNYINTDPIISPGLFIFGGYGPVFIEANRAGYSFYGDGTYFSSLVLHLRTHQFRSNDKGLSDRKPAVEAGLHLGRRWPGDFVTRFAFLHDIIGTHKSYEFDLQLYRRNVIGPLRLLTAVGVQYQSQKLVEYYYGTSAYQPSSAWGGEIEVIATYPIGNWGLFAGTRIYIFDKEISNSPIADGNGIYQFFTGLGYNF